MPMPMPHKDEDHDGFMERCHSEMSKEMPEQGQRNAVCQKQWEENHAEARAAMPMPMPDEEHGDYMKRCMADHAEGECEKKWQHKALNVGRLREAFAARNQGLPKSEAIPLPEGLHLYPNVLQAVYGQPWAILPSMYATICSLVAFRASGGRLTAEEIKERIGASRVRAGAARSGSIAVLPLYGVLAQHMDMMTAMSGGTSTDRAGAAIQGALNDPSISAIVLDIDSPGGSVYGVQEMHDLIMGGRGRKPIVAVANSMAASAAYWIASAADEIVVTPGGEVGSIGVVAAHEDVSKLEEAMGIKHTLVSHGDNKVLGNSFEALSDMARGELQKRVTQYGHMFEAAVAKGRGVSAGHVRSEFGQGLMFGADEAVKRGLADTVGTLQSTIERLAGVKSQGGARADSSMAEIEALQFRPRSLRIKA